MKPNRILQLIALGIGFLFLYIPIVSLIVYSFNESQLVTVWTRFSTRWYAALLQDDELIAAAWLSLRVALLTAFASVVIGTWAGFRARADGAVSRLHAVYGNDQCAVGDSRSDSGDFAAAAVHRNGASGWGGRPDAAFSRSGSGT